MRLSDGYAYVSAIDLSPPEMKEFHPTVILEFLKRKLEKSVLKVSFDSYFGFKPPLLIVKI